MSNWTVPKVYLYLVALITFTVALVNFIILVNSIVDIFVGVDYGYRISIEQARSEIYFQKYGVYPERGNETILISQEEIDNYIKEKNQENMKQQRTYTLKSLLKNGVTFLVLLPIHLYFFSLARKSG